MQQRSVSLLFILFDRCISKAIIVAASFKFHQVSMAQILRLVHRLDAFCPRLLLLANSHCDLCYVLFRGH